MDFDSITVAVLVLRPDAPQLDQAAGAALQDAHMTYLAELHEAGRLQAAGPLLGDAPSDFHGLALLACDVEEARRLLDADPAVAGGTYRVEYFPWMVPGGAVGFAPTRFPRSMAEVVGG